MQKLKKAQIHFIKHYAILEYLRSKKKPPLKLIKGGYRGNTEVGN